MLTIVGVVGFSGLAQAGLNDGLVAYYPFNGNADDESGNNLNGIEKGTINYVPGVKGSALKFDGVGTYINAGSSPLFNVNQHSIIAWVNYQRNSNENAYTIVGKVKPFVYETIHFQIGTDGNLITSFATDNEANHELISQYISADEWHLVALTYTGNYVNFYIDGVLKDKYPRTGSVRINTNDLAIGRHGGDADQGGHDIFFNGLIDDLRIYSRALPETEIQELYNEGSTPSEEDPETPVAILSENLDIHIPVLHYQVNESTTANLDIYLTSISSKSGNLTWKLGSYSDTTCSKLVLNSCSSTYTSATAASNEAVSEKPFNIHIPAINYLENNYWADLKFAGTQDDNLTWELENHGVSEELFGKEQIARAITRALSNVGKSLAISELIESNLAKYSADIIAHVLSYQTLFPITIEDISTIITPLKKKGDLFNTGSKKDYLFLVTDVLIEGVKSYIEFKYKNDIGAQKGFVWMTDIAYNNIKAAITGNALDGVISNGKVLYDIGKENYNAYGEYVAITWDVKYSQTFGNIATLADTYQQYYSKSPSSKQHFLDEFEGECKKYKEEEGVVFSSDYLLAFNSEISLLCFDYQVKFRDFDANKEGGINYFTSINDQSGFKTFLEKYIHPDERDVYIQSFESRNGVTL